MKILFFILEQYNRIAVLILLGQKRLLSYIFSYVAFKVSKDFVLRTQQRLTSAQTYLVLDSFRTFGIYVPKKDRPTEELQRILSAFQQYFVGMEIRPEFMEIAESLYTVITADENEINNHSNFAR